MASAHALSLFTKPDSLYFMESTVDILDRNLYEGTAMATKSLSRDSIVNRRSAVMLLKLSLKRDSIQRERRFAAKAKVASAYQILK